LTVGNYAPLIQYENMNVSPYDNGNDFEDIGFDVDNINFKKPLLFGFFSHQYQAAPKTVPNNMR
tara:strand:- start:91 stop:282 length:192 start_codon:yes stop_codon:yes gene_type:complete